MIQLKCDSTSGQTVEASVPDFSSMVQTALCVRRNESGFDGVFASTSRLGANEPNLPTPPDLAASRRKRRHPQAVSAMLRLKRFHAIAAEDGNDDVADGSDIIEVADEAFENCSETSHEADSDRAGKRSDYSEEHTPPYHQSGELPTQTAKSNSLILSLLPSFFSSATAAAAVSSRSAERGVAAAKAGSAAMPLGSTSSRESSPFSTSPSLSSSGLGSSANTTTSASASIPCPMSMAQDQPYAASVGLSNLFALTRKIEANILGKVQSEMTRTPEAKPNFSIDNILKTQQQAEPDPGNTTLGNISCSLSSLLTNVARSTAAALPLDTLLHVNTDMNVADRNQASSGVLMAGDLSATKGPVSGSPHEERAFPDGPPNRFPAWIFCTRYSDRPSSGSRSRRLKSKTRETASGSANDGKRGTDGGGASGSAEEEKRPRTAFTAEQLARLKQQFVDSRYLTEKRRQELAHELGLNESQIKIWFQNKRAKLKKSGHTAISIPLTNKATTPLDVLSSATNAMTPIASASFAAMQLMATRHGIYTDSAVTI